MIKQDSPVEVSDDSTITPISREEIKKVDATQWYRSTIQELLNQVETLTARKYAALNMSRPDIAAQVQLGIEALHQQIHHRKSMQRDHE